tara:strand:+ start:2371 stop:2985 length:615 start_codon:yes stop_codon:yes gene_type:complete
MPRNPVIVFEGVETSGKSTNINSVCKYLKKKKIKYLKFREPGGSIYSEKIRKLLLNKNSQLSIKTDLLLMLASRSENYSKLIKKNYKKKIILIDRFIDSTYAYQHYGMGIPKNVIKSINKFIIGSFKPDLTFLSIVNNKDLLNRLRRRKRKDRYDKFNNNFFRKVQEGFLKIAKKKDNYVLLDSSKYNSKEIGDQIIHRINKLI